MKSGENKGFGRKTVLFCSVYGQCMVKYYDEVFNFTEKFLEIDG